MGQTLVRSERKPGLGCVNAAILLSGPTALGKAADRDTPDPTIGHVGTNPFKEVAEAGSSPHSRITLAKEIEGIARKRREKMREWSFERFTLSIDPYQGTADLSDGKDLRPEHEVTLGLEELLRVPVGRVSDVDLDPTADSHHTMAMPHEHARKRSMHKRSTHWLDPTLVDNPQLAGIRHMLPYMARFSAFAGFLQFGLYARVNALIRARVHFRVAM